MLSAATSVAGVFVGMSRSRQQNQLHVVAEDMADAREQFVEAMGRDQAEPGLDHAAQRVIDAVRELVSDGPVRLITEKLERLIAEAEREERVAERWEQTAARFKAQHGSTRPRTMSTPKCTAVARMKPAASGQRLQNR